MAGTIVMSLLPAWSHSGPGQIQRPSLQPIGHFGARLTFAVLPFAQPVPAVPGDSGLVVPGTLVLVHNARTPCCHGARVEALACGGASGGASGGADCGCGCGCGCGCIAYTTDVGSRLAGRHVGAARCSRRSRRWRRRRRRRRSPYSPLTRPSLAPYSPLTRPLRTPYAPLTHPLLTPYSLLTRPLLTPYLPYTPLNRATRRRVPGSLATTSGRNTPWTWKGAGWCRASSWTTGSSVLLQ